MSGLLHTVHVRVNDSATGRPTACRVRFTDSAGNYYAPFGRLTEFATERGQDVGGSVQLDYKKFAYIDGSCEINLPAGLIQVEINKGPEYQPLTEELTLSPGKLALRFTLQRWTDLRQQGWYSGDARAHFLPPHAALLEAAAEDLAVVNLLATVCMTGESLHMAQSVASGSFTLSNILAFSGQRPALELPGHLVVVNTLNSHPVLGTLALLNCHRVVYPLTFGGPDGWDNWTLADWCDQCHRKKGLVVWARAAPENVAFRCGEPLADLILGKVDAFELDHASLAIGRQTSPPRQKPLTTHHSPLLDWYAVLNCGIKIPLVGSSGKESNAVPLGSIRTYARLPPTKQLTYANWIEAIRAGRTFVTRAPLLCLTVDDHDPGAVIDLSSPSQKLRVRAEASSQTPFDRLEIVGNGFVLAKAKAKGFPWLAVLEADLHLPNGGWLAARCIGEPHVDKQADNREVFAHTSPVYVRVAGQHAPVDPEAAATLADELDKLLDWVQREARFQNEKQRERLTGVFKTAQQELLKRTSGK